MRISSQSRLVSSNTADSPSVIGRARLAKRFACSLCTKLTGARSVSRIAKRFAAAVGKRLNSSSCPSSSCWAAATLASGTCSIQALHSSGSTNSGAAVGDSSGSANSLMAPFWPIRLAASWCCAEHIAVARVKAGEERGEKHEQQREYQAGDRQPQRSARGEQHYAQGQQRQHQHDQ